MESRLDHLYRSVLLTKFFTRGWGHPDHLQQIIKYDTISVTLSIAMFTLQAEKAAGEQEHCPGVPQQQQHQHYHHQAGEPR
jgi:hypothetical protein